MVVLQMLLMIIALEHYSLKSDNVTLHLSGNAKNNAKCRLKVQNI